MIIEKIITDEYIKERLREWGEWFSRDITNNIGFPRRNILARLRDEGGQIIRATGQKPLPTHTKAEEMESILMVLNKNQPVLAYILMITYLYPDKCIWMVEEELGCKKSHYYMQLNLAFAWVKGYLIAKMQRKLKNKKNYLKRYENDQLQPSK
jgi:hypothetical protein